MRRNNIIIILNAVLILILIPGYYFLYNIYEIKVEVTPHQLYADSHSEAEIKVIPINALGSKALFRSTISDFRIIEGEELVEVLILDRATSTLKLKSKGKEGKIGIKIYNSHSLFPQYVEIPVLPLRV